MKDRKWVLTLLLTILLLGAILLLLWRTGFFQAADSVEALQEYIERWTPYSHAVFFIVQFSSVVWPPFPVILPQWSALFCSAPFPLF